MILLLLYRHYDKMNIAVAILGKCKNYPNCRVSKNCITPAIPTKEHCWDHPDEINGKRCGRVPTAYWNAKEYFQVIEGRLSGTVNVIRLCRVMLIKYKFYISSSQCIGRWCKSGMSQGLKIWDVSFNVGGQRFGAEQYNNKGGAKI